MRAMLRGLAAVRAIGLAAAFLLGAAGVTRGDELADRYRPWGVDLGGRDPSTRPGDDFFRHVNGRWLDGTTIEPDQVANGVDRVLIDRVNRQIRAILEGSEEEGGAAARADARKIADFYASFMDEARAESLDVSPVEAQLDRLRRATSHADLVALQGTDYGRFGMSLFSYQILADSGAPESYAVTLGQRGLGLPDRDYYLDPSFAAAKAEYVRYVAELLGMAGWEAASAGAIVDFETRLAEASWNATDRQDPVATYNPTTVAALERETGFPVRLLLAEASLPGVERVVVSERSALPKLAAIFAGQRLAVLKAWQAFHVLDGAAPFLSRRFVEAHFRFRKQRLDGVGQLSERWKRGVAAVDSSMGEALGRVYVARHARPEIRDRIDAMVATMRTALASRIERNDWMEAATKEKALEKLAMLRSKVAWPKRWRDYTALAVDRQDLLGNVERGMAFEWERQVARLDRPVDRDEWAMTPQTVNAYYDWQLNEILLPAAQLQPPAYNVEADLAVNYGAIGSLIGHELLHGFDSAGRKFDGSGRLRDWWTTRDSREFDERSAALGRQYGTMEVYPGAFVNGELTLTENIADLGGALLALDAYRLALGGREDAVKDGLTGTQRFFLGFAQSWRTKSREDFIRGKLVSDVHAPAAQRVNGTVRNMDEWYRAFGIEAGQALYVAPDARVRLW